MYDFTAEEVLNVITNFLTINKILILSALQWGNSFRPLLKFVLL